MKHLSSVHKDELEKMSIDVLINFTNLPALVAVATVIKLEAALGL